MDNVSISPPSWEQLRQLVLNASSELIICCPWLSTYGLSKLEEFLDEKFALEDSISEDEWMFEDYSSPAIEKIEFLTRLAEEGTDSESLLALWGWLKDKGVEVIVWDSPKLHAKIYMADRREALISSANLSKRGFEEYHEIAVAISEKELLRQVSQLLISIKPHSTRIKMRELEYFVGECSILEDRKPDEITVIWRNREENIEFDFQLHPRNNPWTRHYEVTGTATRNGEGLPGVEMNLEVHYKTTISYWPVEGFLLTDESGIAKETFYIGNATPGYTVKLYAHFRYNDLKITKEDSFTPR